MLLNILISLFGITIFSIGVLVVTDAKSNDSDTIILVMRTLNN